MKEPHTVLLREFSMCNGETNVVAFKEAGDELVDFIVRGQKYSWYDAFLRPIIFLYRHYLEIELKFWIDDLYKLNHKKPIKLRSHDLKNLWGKMKPFLLPFCKSQEEQKMLYEVEIIVMMFHEYDPTGQETRYVRTTKGNETLQKLPPKIEVNSIKYSIQKVNDFFNGLSGVIYG